MYEKIKEVINTYDDFIITSHVSPDCDAIGSEIAFFIHLKSKNKSARIINVSETPENFSFLDKNEVIEVYNARVHDTVIKNAKTIFILDTNDYQRLREMSDAVKSSDAVKICIDHHEGLDEKDFSFFISDTSSPATGEILYDYFASLDKKIINKEIAEGLYAAIMTDTGSFKFSRTTPKTHRIAAELLEYGLNPFVIYSEIYNNSTPNKLKLLSCFLENIKYAGDKTAYSSLSKSDFEKSHTVEQDSDGFTSYIMTLKDIELGIIFLETPKGIKISFRSKSYVPVNKLAKEFGGGGHINASGAFITDCSLEETINSVIAKSKSFIN